MPWHCSHLGFILELPFLASTRLYHSTQCRSTLSWQPTYFDSDTKNVKTLRTPKHTMHYQCDSKIRPSRLSEPSTYHTGSWLHTLWHDDCLHIRPPSLQTMCHSQTRSQIISARHEKKGDYDPPRRSNGCGEPDEASTSPTHIVPCPPVVR